MWRVLWYLHCKFHPLARVKPLIATPLLSGTLSAPSEQCALPQRAPGKAREEGPQAAALLGRRFMRGEATCAVVLGRLPGTCRCELLSLDLNREYGM